MQSKVVEHQALPARRSRKVRGGTAIQNNAPFAAIATAPRSPAAIRESFLKHEEIFIGESGAERDEEFNRKNICHIFMRHIMFTQPHIQHAFGNSAELFFCRQVRAVEPLLAAPLDDALKSCFVPLQKEVL